MLGFVEGRALGAALGMPLGSDDTEGAAEMVGDEDGSGLRVKRKNGQPETNKNVSNHIHKRSLHKSEVVIIRQYMCVLLHQLQRKLT